MGKKLGEGTYGSVYKLEMKNPLESFVIKVSLQQNDLLSYPFAEINTLSTFRCYEILHLIEINSNLMCAPAPMGHLGLVLPFASTSLVDDIRFWTNLEIRWFIEFLIDILVGLSGLHSQHIAHLDIKPDNILVDILQTKRHYRLADFGLSRIFSASNEFRKARHLFGSMPWIPPEGVAPRQTFSLKSDIWSLGATIIQILSKNRDVSKNFFDHQTILTPGYRTQHLDIPARILFGRTPGATELIRMVRSMLNPDPNKRPSAKDLLNDNFFTVIAERPISRCNSRTINNFPKDTKGHWSVAKKVLLDGFMDLVRIPVKINIFTWFQIAHLYHRFFRVYMNVLTNMDISKKIENIMRNIFLLSTFIITKISIEEHELNILSEINKYGNPSAISYLVNDLQEIAFSKLQNRFHVFFIFELCRNLEQLVYAHPLLFYESYLDLDLQIVSNYFSKINPDVIESKSITLEHFFKIQMPRFSGESLNRAFNELTR